jgi:hypothetical protein
MDGKWRSDRGGTGMSADRLVMVPPARQPREEKQRDFRRKPWRRQPEDKVSPELRLYILRRDKMCFLWRLSNRHVCQDRYGRIHQPDDLSRLTLDHVHLDGATMGKRAPSDARHLVAMCWAANVKPPSKSEREAERAYLARVEDARERARHDYEEDARANAVSNREPVEPLDEASQ